jgi:hypothetical protein
MYVRFNAELITSDGQLFGIFKAAQHLSDTNQITSPEDDKRLWELFTWFSDKLDLPDKYWRSKNHRPAPKAIAWFKDTADECIKNMHELCAIVQKYGVIVDFVRTTKPGYILYQDDYQVFAEPFKD